MRKKILVFIEWFEPAYKAGGPIRTVSNIVRLLEDSFDVYVFTGDRDLNSDRQLDGIVVKMWLPFDKTIKIKYVSPEEQNYSEVGKVIEEVDPDFIYCSGMYSTVFSVYPLLHLKFGNFKASPVLSPHGMLKPSALSIKPIKKKIFLALSKLIGLHSSVHFHASDESEVLDIKTVFKKAFVDSIIDAPSQLPVGIRPVSKVPGELRIVFIVRVHPIKNLSFVLSLLMQSKGKISLTVVGVVEDSQYWAQCQRMIVNLPPNILVSYLGDRRHDQIRDIIEDHHIMILPTKGENFGHAIYEALALGRPCLISDQTPWRDLIKSYAGWDLPIDNEVKFIETLNNVLSWDDRQFDQWSRGSRLYIEQRVDYDKIKLSYKKLFS